MKEILPAMQEYKDAMDVVLPQIAKAIRRRETYAARLKFKTKLK